MPNALVETQNRLEALYFLATYFATRRGVSKSALDQAIETITSALNHTTDDRGELSKWLEEFALGSKVNPEGVRFRQ